MDKLRDLWKAALCAQHDVNLAKAKASQAESSFALALHEARKELLVPPGYEIDFLGDGKVKPADKCAKLLDQE